MKIPYRQIIRHIDSSIGMDELSEKLFQLGHEHDIEDQILNFELTPNRGDCLSLYGILRDLKAFYKVNLKRNIYELDIPKLELDFKNLSQSSCKKITFLRVDIDDNIEDYKGALKDYFYDLKLNKNNFFTDISNFISYETGQPTHCYDASKINSSIEFQDIDFDKKVSFETLLDTKIELSGKNSVFKSSNEIINLAGVMGNKSSSCTKETRSVLIECAFFNPESIIGQTIKYDIKSDAAHKFERGVDIDCHEDILRRFIYIVKCHSNIKNLQIYTKTYEQSKRLCIECDPNNISKILGVDVSDFNLHKILNNLSFKCEKNNITVPSFRHDIKNENDIAEEVARVLGYDQIPNKKINLPSKSNKDRSCIEKNIKTFFVGKGFTEVINFPFVSGNTKQNAIKVDNPLDSNKEYLRTSLRESLIKNLLYNERRQKDSIKLFEISNIYEDEDNFFGTKKLGIIASGRVGKNYIGFSKMINASYLSEILETVAPYISFDLIPRSEIDSKLKTEILYAEIEISELQEHFQKYDIEPDTIKDFIRYKPISAFPVSIRDLSFSLTDLSNSQKLQDTLLSYENDILKEKYIFDFYHNETKDELKIGFRFTFQSSTKTLEDFEIDLIMQDIINTAYKIESVSIPGLVR